jgi:type IV pilus assembly protein PilB
VNPDFLIAHLVAEKLIDEAKVLDMLDQPRGGNGSLEQTLVGHGLIAEHDLLQAMSLVYGIPYIKLEPSKLDAELAASLPRALMESYCVYPLKREEGTQVLQMAMADPFDVSAIDTFRYITGLQITPVLALREEILAAVSGEYLGKFGLQIIAERVPWDSALEALQATSNTELDSENSTPIIQLVNSILTTAVRASASDIHFEPLEDVVRVRYRIDGILQEIVELPKRVARACAARMKIISDLDISECRKPQDGRTELRTSEGSVDMRVSTLPTVWGEKVVMRVLDQTGEPPTLTQLGLLPEDLEQLKSFLASSHGMILLTGPTGSGKTSTLYAALRLLNQPGVNITTVEDPVDSGAIGAHGVGSSYGVGLSSLRHRPAAGETTLSLLPRRDVPHGRAAQTSGAFL